MKTKFGISVGLFGAAIYFLGILSNYVVLALLVGYVLLFEGNPWLRRAAVKAFAVTLAFDLLVALVNLIPEVCTVVNSMCKIFDDPLNLSTVTNIFSFLTTTINYIGKIVLLILGFSSVKQGVIRIPVIDSILDRHM